MDYFKYPFTKPTEQDICSKVIDLSVFDCHDTKQMVIFANKILYPMENEPGVGYTAIRQGVLVGLEPISFSLHSSLWRYI